MGYERISVLNHPTGMTHVVEKQSASSTSPSRWSRLVFPSQSPSSRGLLSSSPSHGHLSRPAPWRGVPLSGMALHQELSSLPTVFRKVEFEPVACRSEAS